MVILMFWVTLTFVVSFKNSVELKLFNNVVFLFIPVFHLFILGALISKYLKPFLKVSLSRIQNTLNFYLHKHGLAWACVQLWFWHLGKSIQGIRLILTPSMAELI
jgi:hypothetical protein